MNKYYYDGSVEFHVNVRSKFIRYGSILFYLFLMAAGIATINYTDAQLPNHYLIGMLTVAASLSGFLLVIYKMNPRLVGALISTAILVRPFALLSKIYYGISFPVAGNLTAIFLYTAFWIFFMICWLSFVEPYTKYRIEMSGLLKKAKKNLSEIAPPSHG